MLDYDRADPTPTGGAGLKPVKCGRCNLWVRARTWHRHVADLPHASRGGSVWDAPLPPSPDDPHRRRRWGYEPSAPSRSRSRSRE